MRQTLLTRLTHAPRILAPVSGAYALAVADLEGSCFIVSTGGVQPSPPTAVHRLSAPAAGAGGWDRRVYFVERTGRAAIVSLDGGLVGMKDLGPCEHWVAARRAPRSARILPGGSSVEVWDEERGVHLADVIPQTRDSFDVDRVALDAGGRWVALTGLDVQYTSEGDWNWGQQEVLVVAEASTGRPVLDVVVGETTRPSEHEPIPTALTGESCIAGGRFLPLPAAAVEPPERISLEDDPRYDGASHLAALDDGRVALVPGEGSRSILLTDSSGTFLERFELAAPVVALTGVAAGLVAGLEDGALVLLERA